jgi:hypothetical protein
MLKRLTVVATALLLVACTDTTPTNVPQNEDLFSAAKLGFTPTLNPANGNYYQAIADYDEESNLAIDWGAARNAAAALSYKGCPGHLATITSQEENDFIVANFPEADANGYWLGGRKAWGFAYATRGWGWITGEPFFYRNWAASEPNNNGGIERYLQFHLVPTPGVWNDLDWNNPEGSSHKGYVVEFDCSPQGPVVERVSGSGQFFDPRVDEVTGLEGGWRTFSFTARKYADGRVGGEYQLNNRNTDFKAHGAVTCFEMVENQVWLGGVEEQGDGADAPNGVGWRVVDNGQGSAAPADQISFRSRGNDAYGSAFCTEKPGRELFDVESGNVQIQIK